MDRPINSTFEYEEKKIMVVFNSAEDIGYLFRATTLTHCNRRCFFFKKGLCHGSLLVTGDCQPRYREDGNKVFFLLCGV